MSDVMVMHIFIFHLHLKYFVKAYYIFIRVNVKHVSMQNILKICSRGLVHIFQ